MQINFIDSLHTKGIHDNLSVGQNLLDQGSGLKVQTLKKKDLGILITQGAALNHKLRVFINLVDKIKFKF